MADPLQELAETIRNELRNIGLDIPILNIVDAIHNLSSQTFPVYGKIPSGATQVAAHKIANNSTEVIHTVTADKTLYLCQATLTTKNTSGAEGTNTFYVTNASDTIQYYLDNIQSPDQYGITSPHQFYPPLEISAGYKIKVTSSAANVYGTGFIFGYES